MNFVEWVVQLQLRTWVFTDLGRKWEREDDGEPGITDVMLLKEKKKEEKKGSSYTGGRKPIYQNKGRISDGSRQS